MALQDLINKNKKKILRRGPGGQLTEETQEEIQTLAGQAGLQAPPITPAGQGMLGAGPHQQKMAGTPNQKQAALQMSLGPQQELASVQRQQQVRSEATQQEQASMEKSENLKNLGGLGQRVGDFIEVQRQKLAAQQQPVQVGAVDEFQDQDLSQIKPLLAQLRQDPTNMQIMLQVQQALGYDVNKQLAPEEINQLYQSSVEAIASGAAGSIDDDLTVGDLVQQGGLGYDEQQLSDLLGVPLAEVAAMSVGDIRNRVNQLQADEFSKTAELEQQATSGQLGAAERGLARQAAREASRTGVRATEADVQSLENQIASADQVQFAGRSMSVEDLLKDETISGIISEYLQAAPGSEIRERIDRTEPALRDFISRNEALLADAAKQLSGAAGQFQEIQQYNKGLTNVGGTELDPALAGKLIPGLGELRAEKIDPASVPFLSYLNSLDQASKTKIGSELGSLQAQYPQFADQVAKLTPEDWQRLNIAGDGPAWNNYKEILRQADSVSKATNPDQLISTLYNDIGDAGQAQKLLDTQRGLKTLIGYPGIPDSKLRLLDADGDGQLDNLDALKQRAQSLIPQADLQKIIREGGQAYQRQSMGSLTPLDSTGQSVYDSISKYAADGKISKQDIIASNMGLDQLDWILANATNRSNVDLKYVKQRIRNIENEEADKVINQAMGEAFDDPTAQTDWVATVKRAIKSEHDPRKKEALKRRLDYNYANMLKVKAPGTTKKGDSQTGQVILDDGAPV